MKKILAVIVLIAIVLGTASCGNSSKIPEGFDQALYDYAVAAYELVHDYNLGKIDKSSAVQRAETISKNVDSLKTPKNNTKLSDDVFELSYDINKLGITSDLLSFKTAIQFDGNTVKVEESLKELINK